MYCPDCGRRNDEDAQFCGQCGVALAGGRPRGATGTVLGAHELVHQASALKDRGDVAGAIELCRRAVVGEPRHRGAHALLGLLYERKGQTASAIREYRVVLEIDPNSTAEREKLDMLLGGRADDTTPIAAPWWRRGKRSWQIAGLAAGFLVIGVIALSIGILKRGQEQPLSTSTVAQGTQPAPAEGAGTVRSPVTRTARPRSGRPPYPVRPPGVSPFDLRGTRHAAVSPGAPARSSTMTNRRRTRLPAANVVPEAPRRPSGLTERIPPVYLIPGSNLETSAAPVRGIITPVGEEPLDVRPAVEQPEGERGPVEVVAEESDEEELGPAGHIEIWRSSPGARMHIRSTTQPPGSPPAPQVQNVPGRNHQLSAGQLRQQGRHAEAIAKYEAAIGAYARSIEEGLAGVQAVKGIESCRRAIAACRAALGEQ